MSVRSGQPYEGSDRTTAVDRSDLEAASPVQNRIRGRCCERGLEIWGFEDVDAGHYLG